MISCKVLVSFKAWFRCLFLQEDFLSFFNI